MKRKIVSVLMCATMTAALFAGCGGGGDTQASGDAAKTDDAANDAADDDHAAAPEEGAPCAKDHQRAAIRTAQSQPGYGSQR